MKKIAELLANSEYFNKRTGQNAQNIPGRGSKRDFKYRWQEVAWEIFLYYAAKMPYVTEKDDAELRNFQRFIFTKAKKDIDFMERVFKKHKKKGHRYFMACFRV